MSYNYNDYEDNTEDSIEDSITEEIVVLLGR